MKHSLILIKSIGKHFDIMTAVFEAVLQDSEHIVPFPYNILGKTDGHLISTLTYIPP